MIRNVFWIQIDPANNTRTLYCQGYDVDTTAFTGTPQPYIAGIDSMQFLYGISSTIGGDVERFVNANNVADWSTVRAVKIAVLAQSALDDNNPPNANAQNYVLLDNPPIPFNDGRTRYVFFNYRIFVKHYLIGEHLC